MSRISQIMLSRRSSRFVKSFGQYCANMTKCISTEPVLDLPLIEANASGNGLVVRLPGFGYGHQDHRGYVQLKQAAKIAEETRIMSYKPHLLGLDVSNQEPFQQLIHKVFQKNLAFIISSYYEFSPAYYKNFLYEDLLVEDRIANIGRSSYLHLNTTSLATTKEILVQSKVKVVHVSADTRRSSPLPIEFVDYFRGRTENVQEEKLEIQKKPTKNYHKISMQVKWSDADHYQHMSHAEYLRYAMDAIKSFTAQGKFSNLQLSNNLERLFCTYHSECRPDDILDISVWENEENPFVLHGYIVNNGQLVFQCTYEFSAKSASS